MFQIPLVLLPSFIRCEMWLGSVNYFAIIRSKIFNIFCSGRFRTLQQGNYIVFFSSLYNNEEMSSWTLVAPHESGPHSPGTNSVTGWLTHRELLQMRPCISIWRLRVRQQGILTWKKLSFPHYSWNDPTLVVNEVVNTIECVSDKWYLK